MQELTLNEIEEVNGGNVVAAVVAIAMTPVSVPVAAVVIGFALGVGLLSSSYIRIARV